MVYCDYNFEKLDSFWNDFWNVLSFVVVVRRKLSESEKKLNKNYKTLFGLKPYEPNAAE